VRQLYASIHGVDWESPSALAAFDANRAFDEALLQDNPCRDKAFFAEVNWADSGHKDRKTGADVWYPQYNFYSLAVGQKRYNIQPAGK
jgi:hypothetical protein